MSLQLKQLVLVNESTLNTISTWMYNQYYKDLGWSFDKVECFMKNSMQEDRLPQTYGLFLDSKIIGMFQFRYDDLDVRSDIYPYLANVYIDEDYRKQGYGRKLLEYAVNIAKEKVHYNEIFLYTEHKGLYEKFGFNYIEDVDTYDANDRIQRLYKLDLM